jgi:hypothetical protein
MTKKQFDSLYERLEYIRAELVLMRHRQLMLDAKLEVTRNALCKKSVNWKKLDEAAFQVASDEAKLLDEGFAELRKIGG